LTFDEPGLYDFYVGSIIMREDKTYLMFDLVRSFLEYWVEQAPERQLGKLYGCVVTDQGEMLATRIGASPLYWLSDYSYQKKVAEKGKLGK
jgi:hypothetical protein